MTLLQARTGEDRLAASQQSEESLTVDIRAANDRGHPLLHAASGRLGDDEGGLSPEHQGIARELRDVVERSLSVVVLQAPSDPSAPIDATYTVLYTS